VRVGIVERRSDGQRALEWHLTEAGKALGPVIISSFMGLQYAQNPLEEGDLDVTVMMWNIKRRVDPGVFPGRRTTIHFDFTDVPEDRRRWWLVNERDAVDLCAFDPGFPSGPLRDNRHARDDRNLVWQAGMVGCSPIR